MSEVGSSVEAVDRGLVVDMKPGERSDGPGDRADVVSEAGNRLFGTCRAVSAPCGEDLATAPEHEPVRRVVRSRAFAWAPASRTLRAPDDHVVLQLEA